MSADAQHVHALDPQIERCEPKDRGLQVVWTDGHESFFHYVWLRDCCYCEACGDCYSSRRLHVPCDAPLEIRPLITSVNDHGNLLIEWAPDAHASCYPAAWLRRHCYDDQSRRARRLVPKTWGSALPIDRVEFDFFMVRRADRQLFELYRALCDYGVVVIRGGPKEAGSVEEFANLVGDVTASAYGRIFDLSTSNRIGTIGTTMHSIPPHTDEPFSYTPPGIMILMCVRDAEDGGNTILVDGFRLANTMREIDPEHFRILTTWSQNFIRRHSGTLDQQAQVPMFRLDDEGEICGVRIHTRSSGPLDLPAEIMEDYFAAYHRITELMMSKAYQVRIKLKPGDAVLFDNHRVLHARTRFTDPRRFLQICSVQREQFHEQFRLLATTLGLPDEARLVLPVGAVR